MAPPSGGDLQRYHPSYAIVSANYLATLGIASQEGRDLVVGCSPAMRRLKDAIARAAPVSRNVLIIGEGDPGKSSSRASCIAAAAANGSPLLP